MVTVGRIVRPQGRRGEVVVALDTDFAEERFQPGAALWTSRAGVTRTLTVTSSWPHQGRWVVAFDGVGSIDDAETLRGTELRVPAEALQPLEAGRVLRARPRRMPRRDDRRAAIVGDVVRVDLGNGTPLLVVMTKRRRGARAAGRADLPARGRGGAKTIAIDPPDGLIELNERAEGAFGGFEGSE